MSLFFLLSCFVSFCVGFGISLLVSANNKAKADKVTQELQAKLAAAESKLKQTGSDAINKIDKLV